MTRRVLVVDDDDAVRAVASVALSRVGGWEVVQAASGEAALDIIGSDVPDVILLDVMMPHLDGPATLARIRENPATQDVPIVFLTARVDRDRTSGLEQLGAHGVLTKPFDPMTLSNELTQIVGFGP